MQQPMTFHQQGIPKIATVIRGKVPTTHMKYHPDGTHLYVTSEQDSRLSIIDCHNRGSLDKLPLKFETDGIKLVEPTHHNKSVLFTGRGDKSLTVGQRHSIFYLSIHDNKLLRNFRGHSGDVTSLSMSPIDDCFLSCSVDRTVRLWNLQQAGAIAEMDLPKVGNGMSLDVEKGPHVVYDSTGLVFCITAPLALDAGHLIHLYDARNYGSGAFAELKLEQSSIVNILQSKGIDINTATTLSKAECKGIQFNTSGKNIIFNTSQGMSLLLDGFDGTAKNAFFSYGTDGTSLSKQPIASSFTPDDKTLLCGNEDGSINCYDIDSGMLVQKLQGHVGPVKCVAANPKYAQIASSCTNTALWLW